MLTAMLVTHGMTIGTVISTDTVLRLKNDMAYLIKMGKKELTPVRCFREGGKQRGQE
jgi:hypothetical protein